MRPPDFKTACTKTRNTGTPEHLLTSYVSFVLEFGLELMVSGYRLVIDGWRLVVSVFGG